MTSRAGGMRLSQYIRTIEDFSAKVTYTPADARERGSLKDFTFVVLERVKGVAKLWSNPLLFQRLYNADIDVVSGSTPVPALCHRCHLPEYIFITNEVFERILAFTLEERGGEMKMGNAFLSLFPNLDERCSSSRCPLPTHTYLADKMDTRRWVEVPSDDEYESHDGGDNSNGGSGKRSLRKSVPHASAGDDKTYHAPRSLPSDFKWPAGAFALRRQ